MPLSAQVYVTNLSPKLVRSPIASLPQTATTTVFNVNGGRVRIVELIGVVTTVVQAQSTVTKWRFTPTGGSVGDVSGTLDINAYAVGDTYVVQGPTAAGAITQVPTRGSSTGGAGSTLGTLGALVLPPGALGLNTAASSTGAMRWVLKYIPIEAGATVTAA